MEESGFLRSVKNNEGSFKVGIAIGPGATYSDVEHIIDTYRDLASVTLICPDWVPKYKDGKVFLTSYPASTIIGYGDC
jgi:hypothetical protein